jgi:hypothetical protein
MMASIRLVQEKGKEPYLEITGEIVHHHDNGDGTFTILLPTEAAEHLKAELEEVMDKMKGKLNPE